MRFRTMIGIIVNGTNPTGSPSGLTYAQGQRSVNYAITGYPAVTTWTGNLNPGDVVTLQTDLASTYTTANCMVTITKVSN
jgi:hypothetical protein